MTSDETAGNLLIQMVAGSYETKQSIEMREAVHAFGTPSIQPLCQLWELAL